MKKPTVLVVEDEEDILQLVVYNLKAADFDVKTARDGYEALSQAKTHLPQLITLDLILPDLDGYEVCRELKRSPITQAIPIIILSARAQEIDRVIGLELGADDYVVKPFSPRELVLRIQKILQHLAPKHRSDPVWQKEGLVVDADAHRVTVDEREARLTATEFRLIAELIRNKGKVLSRDKLLDKVWGYQFDGYGRTVDTHIRRLRDKLGPYGNQIETMRGVGYRLRG
jgi:two-component system phosphate regulon response regulator PhoB